MPIVDTAVVFPHACLQCRGTIGPFLDTVVEVGMERLYLCMLCLRLDAEQAGFAEGERMDQLIHAKDTVEHVESEVAKRDRELREARALLKEREDSISGLQALVDRLEGDVKVKDLLAEEATRIIRQIHEPELVEQPLTGLGVAG